MLFLGLFLSLLLGNIGCDRLSPSKPKTDNPEQWSIRPHAPTGQYQLFSVEAKTGGTTKTLIFRIDSTNGTTWKLDPDFSKWVVIEGGASPAQPQPTMRYNPATGKVEPIRPSKEEVEAAKKRLGLE